MVITCSFFIIHDHCRSQIYIVILATSNTLDSMSWMSHCIRSSVIKTQNCQSQTTESLTPLVSPDLKLVLLTFCWSMSDASKTLAASLSITGNVECSVASHKDHISGPGSIVYELLTYKRRVLGSLPWAKTSKRQPWKYATRRMWVIWNNADNAVEVSSLKAITTRPLPEPQLAPISTFPVNQNESFPNLSFRGLTPSYHACGSWCSHCAAPPISSPSRPVQQHDNLFSTKKLKLDDFIIIRISPQFHYSMVPSARIC